jgi:urease accessory protein
MSDDDFSLSQSVEDYLLLILSDSNLPTGGFVASNGLESTYQHGFLDIPLPPPTAGNNNNNDNIKPLKSIDALLAFIRRSLHSYARLSLPFLNSAYEVVRELSSAVSSSSSGSCSTGGGATGSSSSSPGAAETLDKLAMLDRQLDSMMLSVVAKRASKAQGTALLTLYARAFAGPQSEEEGEQPGGGSGGGTMSMARLLATFKGMMRKGETGVEGHLPICWAMLTAALGLSLGKSRHRVGIPLPLEWAAS